MLIAAIIEIIFSVGMFINAGLFVPQAIKIYRTKSTEGLSLLTFAGFNIIQFFTILHGYLHQDFLLMLSVGASFITCGAVTVLILIYQDRH